MANPKAEKLTNDVKWTKRKKREIREGKKRQRERERYTYTHKQTETKNIYIENKTVKKQKEKIL